MLGWLEETGVCSNVDVWGKKKFYNFVDLKEWLKKAEVEEVDDDDELLMIERRRGKRQRGKRSRRSCLRRVTKKVTRQRVKQLKVPRKEVVENSGSD